MFAFHAIPLDTALVDTFPVDVVPSALQALFLPICEGIVVGLVLGAALMFVMSTIERLLARRTDVQATDARLTKTRPAGAGQPSPRPATARRAPEPRPHCPAPQRPALLARAT